MFLYYTGYANEMGHGTRIFVVGLSTGSPLRLGDQTWSVVVGEYWFFGYVFIYDKLGYLLESFKENKGACEHCNNQRAGYLPNSSTFLFLEKYITGLWFLFFSSICVCV